MNMTVLELLKKELPSNYVVALIENMDNKEALNYEAESLLVEIQDLFDWELSREGYLFWESAYEAIKYGAKLPELPFITTFYPNTYISVEEGSYFLNAEDTGVDLMVVLDMNIKPNSREAKYFKEKHLAFCN